MARVRFTTSIASPYWSYAPQQEVSVGTKYSADEIPADVAEAWLTSGVLEPVVAKPAVTTHAPKSGKR